MKIYSIRIKGFQQFNDTFINLTNPETGQPANKICIIGENGTGKSTLLNILAGILGNLASYERNVPVNRFYVFKFDYNNNKYYYYLCSTEATIFNENVDHGYPDWFNILTSSDTYHYAVAQHDIHEKYSVTDVGFLTGIRLKDNSTDVLIHSPAESITNPGLTISDVPYASLGDALAFLNSFPFIHVITNDTVAVFWKILIFLIKNRENEREQFENIPENLDKTKNQLIAEFEKINPKILNKIADLWNSILDKAGLEFDVEKADNPIQLNENLKAYIVLKRTRERINYNNLSTGIRNFIFRLGHIFALYFNREIKRGFVLIDEPENSLFPDFLFDLVSIYEKVLIDKNGENNTQLFMATHNPIIAAQFEPHERVILDWDDNGYVQAFKGVAPVGDDPNDILLKDFKLAHVMGKKGQEFWVEYLELKKKLRKTTDENEKEALVKEISEIGTKYNFK